MALPLPDLPPMSAAVPSFLSLPHLWVPAYWGTPGFQLANSGSWSPHILNFPGLKKVILGAHAGVLLVEEGSFTHSHTDLGILVLSLPFLTINMVIFFTKFARWLILQFVCCIFNYSFDINSTYIMILTHHSSLPGYTWCGRIQNNQVWFF